MGGDGLMRRASFIHTAQQMRDRTKTQTRRLSWRWAKAGMLLLAVERTMGIRKGEGHLVEVFGPIRITGVQREPLNVITPEDVVAEGFPELTPAGFVEMFCTHMRCPFDIELARVCFEHVEVERG